jgi:hypothetical protein
MVLMAAALGLKLFRPEDVHDVGSFLTSILPILFVVPLVNLMDCWDQVRENLIPLLDNIVKDRDKRNEQVAALMAADGLPVDYARMKERFGKTIGRPHFGQYPVATRAKRTRKKSETSAIVPTVERTFCPAVFCAIEIDGLNPETRSTSGFGNCPKNCRA